MSKMHLKAALIFGATGTIGRELSLALAQHVDSLNLTSLNSQKLTDLALEIKKTAPAVSVNHFSLDLRNYKPDALSALPPQNTILFCSGVHSGLKYIDELTDTEIEETFQVNLTGIIKASREVLGKATEGGTIIFLNSMSNRQMAKRNSSLYETQKLALHRFIQAYRNEAVLKKVKVIEVNLGLFESQLTHDAYGGKEEFRKKFGKLELLKEQTVANTILWLLTNHGNTFITEINLTTVDQCYQSAMMS